MSLEHLEQLFPELGSVVHPSIRQTLESEVFCFLLVLSLSLSLSFLCFFLFSLSLPF